MLILKFLHWEECSFIDYKNSCLAYGYNCESSPDFIDFMLRHNAPLKFYAYRKNGQTKGSVCVENGWIANDNKNDKKAIDSLPVPCTAIYLPFDSSSKTLLPFKSKHIHHLQKDYFLNVSYKLFNKRQLALAKNVTTDFSKKTISTRERELRKFLQNGGEFVPVSQINSTELFDIYKELFFARRNKSVKDEDLNRLFFKEFHSHFRGDVMYLNGEAVAIQLLISTSSKAGFFVDFINIGYKMDANVNSLGTMIMWKNLRSLHDEATSTNQPLHYSYGFMSGDYKDRWCNPVSLGRSLF